MHGAGDNNKKYYNYIKTRKQFIKGSPHLKHKSLNDYYLSLVKKCCSPKICPRVLDVGAGDGSATLSFIIEGCSVTGVDISVEQLNRFKETFPQYASQCNIVCDDVNVYLDKNEDKYDIIMFNSFLHHIPDYISLLKKSIRHLSNNGVVFVFQDPIYYSALPKFHLRFCKTAYFFWRITQGDVFGGIKRRLKRSSGDFTDPESDVEYHVVRDGVNQDEIMDLLKNSGFTVEYYPYFSTQSGMFQWLGQVLGIKSTFSIIAKRFEEK